MKILIGCADFSKRAGMQMYLATLAKELISRGYDVLIVADLGIGLFPEIPQMLLADDYSAFGKPDVLILNEPCSEHLLNRYPDVPAYNIIHSPRLDDRPILRQPQIRKYFAVKPEDREYIRSFGIEERFIDDLPIPISTTHFRPIAADSKWELASISTIDRFRQPMFLALIEYACDHPDHQVLIAGSDHGGLDGLNVDLETIENLTVIKKDIQDVRPFIAQSKAVVSMFEGTIALEARCMGKPTVICDREGKPTVNTDHLNPKHYAENVCDKLLSIVCEKWADIIIPHHNRADLLVGCLDSIPKLNFNVIVAKHGGSFAENCNRGARAADNRTLIFVNDDMILNPQALWTMLDHPADIVGGGCVYPDGRPQYLGIGLRRLPEDGKIHYFMSGGPESFLYASGGFFKISKALFLSANNGKGFDEEYHCGGGEDQDMMLELMERGATVGFCNIPIIHYLSQSEGRFKNVEANELRLRQRWLDDEARLFSFLKIKEGTDILCVK